MLESNMIRKFIVDFKEEKFIWKRLMIVVLNLYTMVGLLSDITFKDCKYSFIL